MTRSNRAFKRRYSRQAISPARSCGACHCSFEEPTDENSVRRSLAICDYSDRLPAYPLDIRICSYLAVTIPGNSDLWQVFDAPAIHALRATRGISRHPANGSRSPLLTRSGPISISLGSSRAPVRDTGHWLRPRHLFRTCCVAAPSRSANDWDLSRCDPSAWSQEFLDRSASDDREGYVVVFKVR